MSPNESKLQEFEALALEHLNALYRHAVSLTRNPTKAEDLVQETYLKAFRAFDDFQKGTNIKAWLFKILRNQFISEYRKNHRTEEQDPEQIEQSFSYYGRALERTKPEPGLFPGEESIRPERLEYILGDEVIRALEQLSEEFREVIYLCDVQELSYQEIAQILDIPVGTVRSRLARARAILQKHLWSYAENKGLWRRTAKPSQMRMIFL